MIFLHHRASHIPIKDPLPVLKIHKGVITAHQSVGPLLPGAYALNNRDHLKRLFRPRDL